MNMHEPSYTRLHGPMEVPLRVVQLGNEIATLKQEAAWERGEHTAKTLVKEGGLSVVLVLLPAGGALAEHKTEGPATIHCLTGQMTLHAQGREIELREGEMASLDGGVAHRVDAGTETALLVSIAR